MDDGLTKPGGGSKAPQRTVPAAGRALVDAAGTGAALALGGPLRGRLSGVRADLARLARIGANALNAYAPRPQRKRAEGHAATVYAQGQDAATATAAHMERLSSARSGVLARQIKSGAGIPHRAAPPAAISDRRGNRGQADRSHGANLDAGVHGLESVPQRGEKPDAGPAEAPLRAGRGNRLGVDRLKVEMLRVTAAASSLASGGEMEAAGAGGRDQTGSAGLTSNVAEKAGKPRPKQVSAPGPAKSKLSAAALTLRAIPQQQWLAARGAVVRLSSGRQVAEQSAAAPDAASLRFQAAGPGSRDSMAAVSGTAMPMQQAANGALATSAAASAGKPAQSERGGPQQGDVYLDGVLMGRWMSRVLAREAGRAPSGGAAFDPRRSPLPSGRMIGG